MASKYTEESLKSLKKDELIKLLLNHNANVVFDKMDALSNELNKRFDNLSVEVTDLFRKLESDVEIVKNTNKILNQQIIDLQRQVSSNSQYARRDCLEIFGIPESVSMSELEDKVCSLFGKINVETSSDKIQSCHRLRNKKTTIIKLSNRKDCQTILKSKSKFKNLSFVDLGFAEGTEIFVKESLSSYYKLLWSQCKNLYQKKRIASFYTINGTVRIKIKENEAPISITHHVDLATHFPDFNFEERYNN